jgi:signal transduction histidine kinase
MLNVLLMDQDCNHLTFLRSLFATIPCRISIAYDAELFLNVIKQTQIDFIIGNFFLPNLLWERIDDQAWCLTQQERIPLKARLIYYNPSELNDQSSPVLQALRIADWIIPSSDNIQVLQQKIKNIFECYLVKSGQNRLEEKLDALSTEYYSLHQILKTILDVGKLNVWEWNLNTCKVNDVGYRPSISHPNGYLYPDTSLDWFMDLVHPEDKAILEQALDKTLANGEPYDCEFRLELNNQIEWIRSRGYHVHDPLFQWKRCIGIWYKISREKHNELLIDQQKNALNQIKQINVLGEMTVTLTHQLAQPLHIIKSYITGCIYRIRNNAYNPQEILDALQSASSHVDLAGELIYSFKKLIQNNEVEFEKCDVNKIIQACVDLLKEQLRSIKVHLHLDDTLPLIDINKAQLMQVINNIIKNAMDVFNEYDTKHPVISITTFQHNAHTIKVTIRDNGPGISERVLENLFVPCFTTKQNGMGMGLKICQQIIQAHGGSISAHSESGQGAQFHFTLPVTTN